MKYTRQQMMETVERSPAFVAAQDKAGWLSLFSADGVVEDPVGTAPHHRGAGLEKKSGSDELSRFYDTFIAGNEIRFEVLRDLSSGDEVVRDVIIHTRLSTGLSISVPAHLTYLVTGDGGDVGDVGHGGALRIRRLRASWDLRQRSISALGAGWRGLYTLVVISARMFAIQGVRGVLGYSRALVSGIFGRGATVAASLVEAVKKNDAPSLAALCEADAKLEFPAGSLLLPQEFLAALGDKADLVVENVTPAGWQISFRYSVGEKRGVGFLDFNPRSKKISAGRFFVEETSNAAGREGAQSKNGMSALRSEG